MSEFRSSMDRALERPMRGVDWLGYALLALAYLLFVLVLEYVIPSTSMVPAV